MCGICGEIDFNHGIKVEPIRRMCKVLAHRGPDDDGIVLIKRDRSFEVR